MKALGVCCFLKWTRRPSLLQYCKKSCILVYGLLYVIPIKIFYKRVGPSRIIPGLKIAMSKFLSE